MTQLELELILISDQRLPRSLHLLTSKLDVNAICVTKLIKFAKCTHLIFAPRRISHLVFDFDFAARTSKLKSTHAHQIMCCVVSQARFEKACISFYTKLCAN